MSRQQRHCDGQTILSRVKHDVIGGYNLSHRIQTSNRNSADSHHVFSFV
jgi:hypothetical protein